MTLRHVLPVFAVSLLGALTAAPAQAEFTYVGSFGAPGTGAGQFSRPDGIAVNQATGDVYVTDQFAHRIEQFDADGNFIRMWGRGVNQTTSGDVCPIGPGDLCGPGERGGAAGQLDEPTGIAVDNSSGMVFVQDGRNYRVVKFSAAGHFILTWGKGVNATTGGDMCTAASLNVCRAGEQFNSNTVTGVFDWGPVSAAEPNGGTFFTQPAIAVDGNGYVYVVDAATQPNPRVQKFDSSGSFVGQIASDNGPVGSISPLGITRGLSAPVGIAVNDTGEVYVRDAFGYPSTATKVFTPGEFTSTGADAQWSRVIARSRHTNRQGGGAITLDPVNQFPILNFRESVGFDPTNSCPGTTEPTGYMISAYHPTDLLADCSVPTSPPVGEATYPEPEGSGGIAMGLDRRLYVADMGADRIRVFKAPTPAPPAIVEQKPTEVTGTKAVLTARIVANYADTTFHIEYGPSPCSSNPCSSTPESDTIGGSVSALPVTTQLTALDPGTTYFYRFVATNEEGSPVAGPHRSVTTYANPVFDESCPNNLARQQTGAAFLLDCRAYELVTAEDSGGYDVESDLVDGQAPFGGNPLAEDRVLYGVHNGVVPDSGGKPTNRGLDPYVATRDAAEGRWRTRYVGIPADVGSASPFSSSLAGADAGMMSFAFDGADLCDPCFGDGSVGIPVRMPDGSLTQGMAGSLPVTLPVSAGVVKKHFSADGSHFLFGSEQQFEPEGNPADGNVTIYDRDLVTGATQVVSTLPSGATMAVGPDLAALDVSADGSRIVVGVRLGNDDAGNPLYHLYLHVGADSHTIDLTPSTTSGVLYAGMTAAADRVYFTTHDALPALTNGDGDTTSADLVGADIDAATMSADLTRISTGESGTGDTDSCDPVGNSVNSDAWNVPFGAIEDCSVVAVGGGGGVAAVDGTVYFLSPERLDTSASTQPVEGAPNLYLARPGADPRFVATLESELNGVAPLDGIYQEFGQTFGPFSRATGVAVDHSGGYVYVLDIITKLLKKFDTGGNPVSFSAGQGAGTNQLNGSDAPSGAFVTQTILGLPAEIAVDQSNGRIYVPDFGHDVIDVFAPSGAYLSQIPVTDPSGVAIHPLAHDVYVTTRATAGKVTVFPAGGGPSTTFPVITNPTGVAVDSTGRFYVVNAAQTATYGPSGAFVEVLDPNSASGVAVHPATNDVFVNQRTQVLQFDSTGTPTGGSDGNGAPIGTGELTSSVGTALDAAGNLFVSRANTSVVEFRRFLRPDPQIDNPLALGGVGAADVRRTGDFQITPSGEHAVFGSRLPLTGFDNAGHAEVFRYAISHDALECVSCNPTGSPPTTDAGLASNGLSVTDDGRVFFTSGEQLVMRDANERNDAYEWAAGQVELISSGRSSFDSGLHSVSADGTDAFFFTRDELVSADGNGSLTKIYDAREEGGFFVIPPPPQCAASDECHGAGSPTPPGPAIGTLSSPVGNLPAPPPPRTCPKGQRKVRRGGKVRCVKRRPNRGRKARQGRAGR